MADPAPHVWLRERVDLSRPARSPKQIIAGAPSGALAEDASYEDSLRALQGASEEIREEASIRHLLGEAEKQAGSGETISHAQMKRRLGVSDEEIQAADEVRIRGSEPHA